MNRTSFENIEMAFEFVCSAPQHENEAFISRTTGETYFIPGMGDPDELPADFEESDDYLQIPHKNDLDLGKELVFEFVAKRVPEFTDTVDRIFMSRGAYAKFKQVLESQNALQEWYAFEAQRSEFALRRWCAENGLNIA